MKKIDRFILSIPDYIIFLLIIFGLIFIINGFALWQKENKHQDKSMYALTYPASWIISVTGM